MDGSSFYFLCIVSLLLCVVHGAPMARIKHLDNDTENKAHGILAVLPIPTVLLDNNNIVIRPSRPNHHFHFNFSHENSLKKMHNSQHIDPEVLIHQLSTLTPMLMDELQPPDHMDGVRLEQDGDLNTKYRKEILLGEHGEFDSNVDVKVEGKMKEIFHLVDINKDGFIDTEELNGWMIMKVKEHLDEAKKDSDDVFEHLDIDKDGNVTWNEFSIHFFLAKGYSLERAVSISTSDILDDIAITPEEKEKLIRYRFRWAEADEDTIDGQLDKMEMMNFRHPEQSSFMIKRVAMDLLENFDINEDHEITEEEFVNVPAKFAGNNLSEDQKKDRRNEYNKYIDLNQDGIVTFDELKFYVDPKNLKRLQSEAENLIFLADENNDNKLNLQEVLENSELFFGSKMFDASRNFHDEF